MRYAMIMAGGAGTRLWPMSRKDRPKQLLPFLNGRSLIQLAEERLEGVVPPERRLVCAAERYREAILHAIPALSADRYLGEPMGRDTVNAVGFCAAVLRARDPGAVFAVLTADHLIEPQEEFARRLDLAFRLVEADPTRLCTFSITPTFPATGYGYVERGDAIAGFDGAFRAKRFVEKPDRQTAERYLAEGGFGWNSGMFVFAADTVMKALERFKPECHAGLEQIGEAWETPRRLEVLERIYPTLPRISVDYALMEPAARDTELQVCVVPMNVSWMDVGSWPTYGQTLEADADGNRTNARTAHLDSRNILAVSDDPGHTISVIGCSDLIVVRTTDATLVVPASMAERVKDVAGQVPTSLQ